MCTKGSLRQFRWALSPPGLLFTLIFMPEIDIWNLSLWAKFTCQWRRYEIMDENRWNGWTKLQGGRKRSVKKQNWKSEWTSTFVIEIETMLLDQGYRNEELWDLKIEIEKLFLKSQYTGHSGPYGIKFEEGDLKMETWKWYYVFLTIEILTLLP